MAGSLSGRCRSVTTACLGPYASVPTRRPPSRTSSSSHPTLTLTHRMFAVAEALCIIARPTARAHALQHPAALLHLGSTLHPRAPPGRCLTTGLTARLLARAAAHRALGRVCVLPDHGRIARLLAFLVHVRHHHSPRVLDLVIRVVGRPEPLAHELGLALAQALLAGPELFVALPRETSPEHPGSAVGRGDPPRAAASRDPPLHEPRGASWTPAACRHPRSPARLAHGSPEWSSSPFRSPIHASVRRMCRRARSGPWSLAAPFRPGLASRSASACRRAPALRGASRRSGSCRPARSAPARAGA